LETVALAVFTIAPDMMLYITPKQQFAGKGVKTTTPPDMINPGVYC